MKGIFCHDLPIYRDVNGCYCSTTLNNSLFSRYFRVVDELVVAERVYPIRTTYEDAHQEKIDLPGLSVLELPNLNTHKALFSDFAKARRLLKQALAEADLVIIRGGMIAIIAAGLCIQMNKPYLIELGGCAWDAYWNHGLAGKIIAPYMEYKFRKYTYCAAFAIYVTQDWLQKRYPCKGISVGVSDVYFTDFNESILESRLEKIRARDKYEPVVVGTTAAVNVRYKGQQYIIKAISNLKARGFNFRYELVGGGDYSYLLNLAEKYGVRDLVIFKGELTHSEVLDWLSTIDIYAQPSKIEGLPRALIEAMSRACPAIGTKIAGIPELLEENEMFAKGDIAGIERALLQIVGHMSIAACRNFEKVRMYDVIITDEKRNRILDDYAKFVSHKASSDFVRTDP